MRKQSTLATPDETAIDLTPMLDVVFIMLIFFIVTATFVKEAGINIRKPEADTAEAQKRTSILIAINQDNQVWLDRKQVDPRALKPLLERLYLENPKGSIVIQADKDSNVEVLTEVMNAARDVGAENVAISTDE